MDFRLFRGDNRPASLGLDPSKTGQGLRLGPANARAMGHLVETVTRRHRANSDGLEQDVVAGIAGHDGRIESNV